MKARRVKRLDPTAPLAIGAAAIVRTRLDELCAFMPRAAEPGEVEALHDMRIAAKRLRYVLELTHPCFGPYARTAVKVAKEVQDILGEIHDCDVQVPEVVAMLDELTAEDVRALADAHEGDDLPPTAAATAPHAGEWAGLIALAVQLRARRQVLFARFLELWRGYERKGFRARLEYALSERGEETARSRPVSSRPAIIPDSS